MKIKKGKLDIVLNVLCLIILIGTTVLLISFWHKIPDKLPMHYDFAGNIDRWGAKSEIIILPVITWIMYLFMTVIERFPQMWNTGVQITEENKERVYATLLHLLSSVKLILVVVFTYLTVQSAAGVELPSWFLPAILLAVFGDLGYWIWKVFKVR